MKEIKKERNDLYLQLTIGNLLQTGVVASALVVVSGGLIYLFGHGALPDYKVFRGQPPELRHVSGIIEYAFSFSGKALIQLGLLILIATPVMRVIFSIFSFLRQGDRMYVLVTFIVLVILTFSLFFQK